MTNFVRQSFPSFDGETVSYLDSGTGSPAALLLHGFLTDGWTNFGPAEGILGLIAAFQVPGGPTPPTPEPAGRGGVATRLAGAGFRVLVPDMRGHGQSSKTQAPAAYRGRAMARDMIALLDRLGLERAHVLGYSMGSATAAHLIALAPARLSSVIFGGIGAYIVAGEPMDLPAEFVIPDWVPRPVTFAAFSGYAASIVEGSAPAEGFGALYATLADRIGVDRQVAAAVLRGQLSDAVEPEALRDFDRPVMVLNGDRDSGAVQSEQALEKYLPRLRRVGCRGDHLSAVLDPGFQAAVEEHFSSAR